jgi:hypothetical protein
MIVPRDGSAPIPYPATPCAKPKPETPDSGSMIAVRPGRTCAKSNPIPQPPFTSGNDCFPSVEYCSKVRVYDLGECREAIYSARWRVVGTGVRDGESSMRRKLEGLEGEEMDREQERVANAMKGRQRARSRIRRLLMRYHLSTMWTLTFRENITDLREALTCLSNFLRRVKYRIPDFQYIIVPERQKRGAWHFHFAVNLGWGHAQVAALWPYGFCFVKWPKGAGTRGMVAYMSKYLGKGLEADGEGVGVHRYRVSRNMEVPYEDHLVDGDYEALEVLQRDGFRLSCELVPIVVNGLPWGWFSAAMLASEVDGYSVSDECTGASAARPDSGAAGGPFT